MTAIDLGAVVAFGKEDRLARVYAIGEGRTIHFEWLGDAPCPHCGAEPRFHLLENSPLFKENVKPVKTVVA